MKSNIRPNYNLIPAHSNLEKKKKKWTFLNEPPVSLTMLTRIVVNRENGGVEKDEPGIQQNRTVQRNEKNI